MTTTQKPQAKSTYPVAEYLATLRYEYDSARECERHAEIAGDYMSASDYREKYRELAVRIVEMEKIERAIDEKSSMPETTKMPITERLRSRWTRK